MFMGAQCREHQTHTYTFNNNGCCVTAHFDVCTKKMEMVEKKSPHYKLHI